MHTHLLFAALATAIVAQSADSSPSNLTNQLPPPTTGQSLASWIEDLFIDLPAQDETPAAAGSEATQAGTEAEAYGVAPQVVDDSVATARRQNRRRAPADPKRIAQKRAYVNCSGLHESVYTNETEKATYNITVDLSRRPTGLHLDTTVGDWTLTTGETIKDIALLQLVQDTWSLRHTRKSVNPNFANHTEVNGNAAIDAVNNASNEPTLICPNPAANHALAIQTHQPYEHDELRRLLANTASYWTAAMGVVIGSGGLAAGISSGLQKHYEGNITRLNVVQATLLTSVGAFLAAIVFRCHEVGRLDRVQNVAGGIQQGGLAGAAVVVPPVADALERLAPGGREAVTQNIFIAFVRRLARRVVEARERARGVINAAADNDAAAAANQAAEAAQDACVSDDDVESFVSAVEEMSNPELELVPLAQAEDALQPGHDCGV